SLTLTNTGTYTILVHASGYYITASYTLSIQSHTGGGCIGTAVACGQTVSGSTSYPTEMDAFGLGTGGGTLIFGFSGFSGVEFDLYDPAGNRVFVEGAGGTTNVTLAAGVYTLLVHSSSYSGSGSYGFTLNCFGCNYVISPTGASLGASATNGTVAMTAGSGCCWTNWVAPVSSSWISITSGSGGSGNGTVTYSVAQNCNASARSGQIIIAPCGTTNGFSFVINQANPVTLTGQDIGAPGVPGSFGYSCGTYSVSGSGEGTDGTADVFYFLNQAITGDGQIIVRFQGIQGGDPQLAEAGIMMRQTMDPGSAQVSLSINARTNVMFRRRLAANNSAVQNSLPGMSLVQGTGSLWLRLSRMGSTFIGHYSTNGLDWQYMWFTTLNMTNLVQVGLAVTAHHHGQLATATFDNVTAGVLTPLSGTWPLPGPLLLLGGQAWSQAEFQRVGGFEFLLAGVVGDYFNIKSSSNAAAPFASWPLLSTVTNTYGVIPILDAQALTNKVRFYRAQKLGGP
ncbi:MAG: hypothetical protein C5B50_17195, partial [Verrucomicrobia bacterium]